MSWAIFFMNNPPSWISVSPLVSSIGLSKSLPLSSRTNLASKENGPRRCKLPSDEVRTAIELNQPLYRKFAFLVLLNKYDVLGMVHDPMLIQPAVQEVENLGEMICVSAHTNNRVFAKDFSREVSPLYVIARYPPTVDVRDVLK